MTMTLLDSLIGNYSPGQPRDERGKWTSGGIALHGTTSREHLDSILKNGIIAPKNHTTHWESTRNPDGEYDSHRAKSVYVTKSDRTELPENLDDLRNDVAAKSAAEWAANASQFYTHKAPYVVAIKVPKGTQMVRDEYFPSTGDTEYRLEGKIPPEWIVAWARVKSLNGLYDPDNALEGVGEVVQGSWRRVTHNVLQGYNIYFVGLLLPLDDEGTTANEFNPNQPRDAKGQWTNTESSYGGWGSSEEQHRATSSNKSGGSSQPTYTKERRRLHKQLIAEEMRGTTAVDHPVTHIMGGGPASGKSTLIDSLFPEGTNAVRIDADAIKTRLPEFQERLKKHDPTAGMYVHKESLLISSKLAQKAMKGNRNVIQDGTGNHSLENLSEWLEGIRDKGQRIEGHYVTVPLATALQRNLDRYQRTGRMVPEQDLKAIHHTVSQIIPQAIARGVFDKFTLHDTRTKTPKLVASAVGNKLTIHDPQLWQEFLDKGKE